MSESGAENSAALVITRQRQLFKVDTNGNVKKQVTPALVSKISHNYQEGITWMLPEKQESDGNSLLYSWDDTYDWKLIDLHDLKPLDIASTHVGTCFLITAQGAAVEVDPTGNTALAFSDGTVNCMSVSPEGYIWVISREKKEMGGNMVYWCTYGNYALQQVTGQPVAKKISAGCEGVGRIVTIGGEVASLYLNRMGGLETQGGVHFAKDISTSPRSETIWAICPDPTQKGKKNLLKYWNRNVDPFMEWHVIEGIDPVQVECIS